MPRALIVDDDPISLRFLEAALEQSGCEPIGAESLSAALSAATTNTFDLLLIDRNLPDGSGSELLAALRKHDIACPAIATSAEMTAELQAQLMGAGFAACMEKPVSIERLRETLRPWLESGDAMPLDDDTALTAIGGDRNALRMLRGMLVQELRTLHADVVGDRLADGALLDRLHRLRASCGFCGTPKLAASTIALEQSLRTQSMDISARREKFLTSCRETIEALGT